MLAGKELKKSYGNLQVLKGVSLQITAGETVALVGSSGAGKTTLLQILGTLDAPDSGELWFEERNLLKLSRKQQARFRNEQLGFVFQFHHLMNEFTALENVAIPGLLGKKNSKAVYARATELLELVGLADRTAHKPTELSGGEKQRVAVARALINAPRLLLADEPTGNLDSANGKQLYELFLQLSAEQGLTILTATHDLQMANAMQRRLRMQDGLLAATAPEMNEQA